MDDHDPLSGLLDSPLDEPDPDHRKRRSWIAAWVMLGLASVVAIVLILTRDSDGVDAGPPATTATTVTGVIGVPDSRVYAPLVSTGSDVYLFGGLEPVQNLNGTRYSDVWRFDADAEAWRDLQTPAGPAPRAGAALAYDSGTGVVVLFGGALGSCNYPFCREAASDTWVYDPRANTWEERSPAESPSPRHGHRMVYDSGSDRIVLFGGDSGRSWLEDTWTYDADTDTWVEVQAGEPPWRTAQHAMGYDPVADRVVVWGGADREETMVWTLDPDGGEWEERSLDPAPASAWDSCMVWSAAAERLLLVGGEGYTTVEISEGVTSTAIRWRDEAWALDLGDGTWTMLENLPRPVSQHGCAADPVSAEIVVWAMDTVLLLDPATGRTRTLE